MLKENNDQLRYIRHDRIDFRLYDQCMGRSPDAPVYGCSWFLNHMAGKWDILTWGDYNFVMPVPCRQKWGIRYVYQPVFAQQLGIYPTPPEEIRRAFFNELKKRFRYIHYQISADYPEAVLEGFNIKLLHTRTLSLRPDYALLCSQYDDYITQNLRKARANDMQIIRQTDTRDFFRLQKVSKSIPVPEESWKRLRKLMEATLSAGTGLIYAAETRDQVVHAAAFFLIYRGRAYYMTVVSDSAGREMRAGFALLDRFFRDHAGQPLLFDFEGSSVEGVDKFFESFGAVKEFYQMISLNRLPWFLRLFKK